MSLDKPSTLNYPQSMETPYGSIIQHDSFFVALLRLDEPGKTPNKCRIRNVSPSTCQNMSPQTYPNKVPCVFVVVFQQRSPIKNLSFSRCIEEGILMGMIFPYVLILGLLQSGNQGFALHIFFINRMQNRLEARAKQSSKVDEMGLEPFISY